MIDLSVVVINNKQKRACEHWDIDGEWSRAANEHVPVSRLIDLMHNNDDATTRIRIVRSDIREVRDQEYHNDRRAVIQNLVNAMYSLQSPQSSPWKCPMARFLSTISVDETSSSTTTTELDVTYYVYASRLLFELIANPSIHILMQHLEAVGTVSGPIPIPRKKDVLYLSPEPGEMCPFSLSSLLRYSESTGYGYLAVAREEEASHQTCGGDDGHLNADEHVMGMAQMEKNSNWVPPCPPRSKDLIPNLLEFQQESLAWMMNQESNKAGINGYFWQCREFVDGGPPLYYFPLAGEFRLEKPPVVTGGLLCSEMGLGKTVMCIALALNDSNLYVEQRRHRPSLIVAPVTLCGQWISEIVRHTSPGALPVVKWTGNKIGAVPLNRVTHGETGTSLVDWLNERSSDWRMKSFWNGRESVACKVSLNSLVLPPTNDLRWWPSNLMESQPWCNIEFSGKVSMQHSHMYQTHQDLEDHFISGLSGDDNRCNSLDLLLCSVTFNSTAILGDTRLAVTVTSYDSLRRYRADFSKLHWHRLFLDECQEIKRPTTKIAKSVQCIEATHRWMISGTPLSNSLSDLHGELGFLRVWPFSLVNDGFYEQKLQQPLKRKDPFVLPLLYALIEATMFRHSKSQRYRYDNRPLISLPPYTVELRPVHVPETSSEKYVHRYLELLAKGVYLRIMGSGGGECSFNRNNMYSKLISVLNTIRKAMTHTRLTQLVEIDEVKRLIMSRAMEFQAAPAESSKFIVSSNGAEGGGGKLSNEIIFATPKMVMDFVQTAGSRVGGLHRDTGREIAVGGEGELKLREELEGYSVQELRKRMDELNIPKPKAWIPMSQCGNVVSGSHVMTLSPAAAPFTMKEEEEEEQTLQNVVGEKLRIGSSSGDEVEVKRFQHGIISNSNPSTGCGGSSRFILSKDWQGEDISHVPILRHMLATRKKPYIDILLTRENEFGVLLSSGFKSVIEIISGRSTECAICLNAIKKPVVTKCTHVFCRSCIGVGLDNTAAASTTTGIVCKSSSRVRCPLCRTPLSVKDMMEMAENVEDNICGEESNVVIDVVGTNMTRSSVASVSGHEQQLRKDVGRQQQSLFPSLGCSSGGHCADPRFPSLDSQFISHHNAAAAELRSSKLCALMEDMRASVLVNPNAKFVIFSQFSQSLKAVATILDAEGENFGYRHVDGHLDGKTRTTAVTEFTCLPAQTVRCMLLTTGSAAEGLTLTVASNIYLLDVMLSARDEAQALNRAHRIGQSSPVRCVIYYMASSVESRLVEMRQAEGSLSSDVIDGARAMNGVAENGGDILSLNSIKTLLGVGENEVVDSLSCE